MSTTVNSSSSTNPYAVTYSASDLMATVTPLNSKSSSTSSSSTSNSSSGTYSQSLVSQMSGLDVNSMVNEMLASDQTKLNQLMSKEQITQWTQDRYRSVISNINDFSSNYFDILSTNNLVSSTNYSAYSANSSNNSAVTAIATNSVTPGSYTINSATLATGAKLSGNSIGSSITNSSAVSSLGLSGTISFTANGKSVSYDLTANSTQTISQMVSSLSSQSGQTVTYSELTGKFSITTSNTGSSQALTISGDNTNADTLFGIATNSSYASVTGTKITGAAISNPNSTTVSSLGINGMVSLTVNGKSVSYTPNSGDTINTMLSSLNSSLSSAGANATISYDSTTNKISIASTTGSSVSVSYDATNSNNSQFMSQVFNINASNAINGSVTQVGSDGSFTITEPDGSSNTVTESSNNFTIDGLNYNFTSNITSPETINVSMDVSSIVSKIQDFVTSYNNLVGGIQDALNEKKDSSYSPLTSDQEQSMTSSQITAWDQKAQQGLLSNDDTLTNFIDDMRSAFYTAVNGVGLTMADVGLSTSDDPTQGAKLTLDTTKLTTTLKQNPQAVINFFSQASTSDPTYSATLNSSQKATRSSEEGIFQRLSDITQKYVGTGFDSNNNEEGLLLQKAGMLNDLSATNNYLYKELKDEAQSVTDFKTQMAADKTRYTTMFTNLQTALSQMSTQQSYISQMLSSSSSG